MTGSIRQRRSSKQGVDFSLCGERRHGRFDREEGVVVVCSAGPGRGRDVWEARCRARCRLAGSSGPRSKSALAAECKGGGAARGRSLLLLGELGFFVVEPVLDLPLVLDDAARVLRLGHAGLARDGDALLGVVVSLQLCYASRNGCLLARRELIFAAQTPESCRSALLVLGVEGDFGGIIARVDDIRPSWRNRGGRVGKHLDVWHVGGWVADGSVTVEK